MNRQNSVNFSDAAMQLEYLRQLEEEAGGAGDYCCYNEDENLEGEGGQMLLDDSENLTFAPNDL